MIVERNFAERETRLSPEMATRDLSGQSVEIGNFLSDPQKDGPPYVNVSLLYNLIFLSLVSPFLIISLCFSEIY